MKPATYIIPASALIILAGVWVSSFISQTSEPSNTTDVPLYARESEISSENGITITVTPEEFSDNEWKFSIAIDTHAGELTTDLENHAALIDEQGNTHAPRSWSGDPPGGHHRNGILLFDPIHPPPASLTLRIKKAGESHERTFVWPVKNEK